MAQTSIMGAAALNELATRFPQLYVAPAEGAQDAHKMASSRGIAPDNANLDHFITTPEDELRIVDTPGGPIEVLFLANRTDFETLLQIVSHKSQPVPIARTVGAITYRGLADWGAVRAAHDAYVADGGEDWRTEFSRLARQPGMFRAELIVISEGPYSNIAASDTPYDTAQWTRVSREIRLSHECAHVVCRRLLPDDIAPVWDEITADVTGLICATGAYDAKLAALFLGVTEAGYTGGRLAEYLTDEQNERIGAIAEEVFGALKRIEECSQGVDPAQAFDFLLQLKRDPFLTY